jgi:hypothetical protein
VGMMENDGGSGMMQQCMDMMNSMMGGGATDTSAVSYMGANMPLSLVVGLVLVGALGYLVGARRARTQA